MKQYPRENLEQSGNKLFLHTLGLEKKREVNQGPQHCRIKETLSVRCYARLQPILGGTSGTSFTHAELKIGFFAVYIHRTAGQSQNICLWDEHLGGKHARDIFPRA